MPRHQIAGAAALVSILSVSACTNPASLDARVDPTQNTKSGVAAGAIIGAGVGAIAGGNNTLKNAAIGAVAGAALGGGIGATLDQQAAEIRQQLANDGITIQNTGDRLIVSLPQDISFDTGSATVRPSLESDLNALAANFVKYQNSKLQVIGNTDNVGDAAYNQTLSEQRAVAVTSILIKGGVAPDRLTSFGRGEDDPIASNLTPEGRAQNRRVDIVVLPKNG